MSPQMSPNYPYMTSGVNDIFTKPLVDKYGINNVTWPILLIKDGESHAYLYEVNAECNINSQLDNRPISKTNKVNYFLDYTAQPRQIIPSAIDLDAIASEQFRNSYKAILASENLNSVDIDYAWYADDHWKAMEFTTMWMPLSSQQEAERLVGMLPRRPSWQGENGPHGIRSLIDASIDLDITFWMVIANSKKGVSNSLVTDGNAFRFPLNHQNIDRILNGEPPLESVFSSFEELIKWL